MPSGHNIDYRTLLSSLATAVSAHTWTRFTTAPTQYVGGRTDVDQDGPVVIMDYGNESRETEVVPNNWHKHDKKLELWGGVPWVDNNPENAYQTGDMATELTAVVMENPHLANAMRVVIDSIQFSPRPLDGPTRQLYRGVLIVITIGDFRHA